MKEKDKDSIVIIPCPPYKDFPEQPKDMSKCDLVACPKCKKPMWLSEKKQIIIEFLPQIDKPCLWACYDCITAHVEDEALTKNTQLRKVEL